MRADLAYGGAPSTVMVGLHCATCGEDGSFALKSKDQLGARSPSEALEYDLIDAFQAAHQIGWFVYQQAWHCPKHELAIIDAE